MFYERFLFHQPRNRLKRELAPTAVPFRSATSWNGMKGPKAGIAWAAGGGFGRNTHTHTHTHTHIHTHARTYSSRQSCGTGVPVYTLSYDNRPKYIRTYPRERQGKGEKTREGGWEGMGNNIPKGKKSVTSEPHFISTSSPPAPALWQICRKYGFVPVCGCWVSLPTLYPGY